MKQITPLLTTLFLQHAGAGQPFARLRNWHDRILSFNKGRGFDMTLIPIPNDPYGCKTITYESGKWMPDHEDDELPCGAPEEFKGFTGVVDGLQCFLSGDFVAFSFYNADGHTSANTYFEASKYLGKAGFQPAPFYETSGNGWNSLEKFANTKILLPELEGAFLGWLVFPSQPRLAESAFRHGLQPAGYIDCKHIWEKVTDVSMVEVALQELPTQVPEPTSDPRLPRKQLLFLISGRFDSSKAEIAQRIESAGHAVSSTYQDDVDVVIIPSLNSRTKATASAREDGKTLVTIDGLEEYLEDYNSN